MLDTPEKLEAPEMVRVRFLPLGGMCHVVGSTTDTLSMESIDSSLDCEFLHEQDFPFLRLLIFSLRIKNGKQPPIIKRKATRIRALADIVQTSLTPASQMQLKFNVIRLLFNRKYRPLYQRTDAIRHVKTFSLG